MYVIGADVRGVSIDLSKFNRMLLDRNSNRTGFSLSADIECACERVLGSFDVKDPL